MIKITKAEDEIIELLLLSESAHALFICKDPKYWEIIAAQAEIDVKIISYEEYIQGYSWKYVGKNIIVEDLEDFVKANTRNALIGYGIQNNKE